MLNISCFLIDYRKSMVKKILSRDVDPLQNPNKRGWPLNVDNFR